MNKHAASILAALAATLAFAAPATAIAPPPDPSATTAIALVRDDGAPLDADPPGTEASKTPKPEEWKDAKPVKLARSAAGCSAYRVREWLKIHCSGMPGAGVSLLAGTREGVLVWVDPKGEGRETTKEPHDAEVVFPLRRGDGRIVQIAQFGEGYDGPLGWNVVYTVSEQWVEGEPAPIVTVH